MNLCILLRSGEVRGESLLLVDGSLYSRCTHRWGGDPDASAGEGGELRGGTDQNMHRLHRRDHPKVNHQHCPLQILVHHYVSCNTRLDW